MGDARATSPTEAGYVVGLDVGTTAVKCVAFPARGGGASVVGTSPTGTLSPRPGQRVQLADDLLAACDAALDDCVSRLDGEIVAIGLSTAMHGLVGLDGRGWPSTHVITWADSRAQEQAARLREQPVARKLHRSTGTPVHAMSPLTKLIWWHENDPELVTRIRTWMDVKGLLLTHLTGRSCIDRSCASGTGLLDLTTGDWLPAALDLAGVGREQLPEVVEPEAVLELSERAAARVGLPAGIPVVAGAGDGPCGNLGTGAVLPGLAGMSLGTSGALRTVFRGDPPENLPPGLFCYALARDRWVLGGAISNGGSALEWLAGTLLAGPASTTRGADSGSRTSGTASAALQARAGLVPPGSEGLVVLPYLSGERAPLWDPTIPGMVLGLRGHHRQQHLARATFEGIALQLGAVLSQITAVADVDRVLVTGGAVRSGWQLDTLAAVFERPVELSREIEGSALGAAALALSGIGGAPSPEEAREVLVPATPSRTHVEPDPELVETYRGVRDRLHELAELAQKVAGSLAQVRQPSEGQSGG